MPYMEDLLPGVIDLAYKFWNCVAEDNRISSEFKKYLDRGNPLDELRSDTVAEQAV